MYDCKLPFSMGFKGEKEIVSFWVSTESVALKLKKSIPIIHYSKAMKHDAVDFEEHEYKICDQLNYFMKVVEKRKARIDRIKKIKGWIDLNHKKLQYFHIYNLINHLAEHKKYCNSEFYALICQLLFPDEYIRTLSSQLMTRESFGGILDVIPIPDESIEKIFLNYIEQTKNPREYNCMGVIDVPLVTLDHIFRSGNIIKKCKHCGKIFVPQRSSEQYCNGLSPEYEGKTCKEAVKYIKQLERERNDPIKQEYKRTYNALYNRTHTKDSKKQELAEKRLSQFMNESEKIKTQLSLEEYRQWLILQKKSKS